MKKILLVIMIISATVAFNNANAQVSQNCGTLATNCNAGPNTQLGFQNSDSIPCIAQGVPYTYSSPFQMYSTFTYPNIGQVTVDSITIDSVWNLPCGMCWSVTKNSRTYSAGEVGCFTFMGTTWDMGGQYNLRLLITAYINGDPTGETIPPSTVDIAGIKLWLRVDSAGICTPVDTAGAATDQVTNSPCATGINEVAANVASINIIPNPVNSSAALSFTAERSATYTVKITDITGQVVSVKEIQASAGANTSTIQRGKLSSGIYFLSLTDGISSVTRKFIIVD